MSEEQDTTTDNGDSLCLIPEEEDENKIANHGDDDDDNCFEVEHNPILSEDQESGGVVGPKSRGYANGGDGESMGSKRYSVSDNTNLDMVIRPQLPRFNCPEKIIVCLDMSMEMDDVPFRLGTGTEFSPHYMAKRVLEIFAFGKSRLNPNHEFAVMVLHESGSWFQDFTNDVKEFVKCLEGLGKLTSCNKADLSSCFDLIEKHVELPKVVDVEVITPPYIVRTIFVYGRSQCVPCFMTGKESFKRLILSEYYFVDVLYMHVVPSEENNCEAIFDTLCELDEFGNSFIFEVTRNPTKLHDCMAKLLAHPLQRALQKDLGGDLQSI